MVLATLCCIELFPIHKLPPRIAWSYRLVDVAPDGRCLWSCIWLAVGASQSDLVGWYMRERSPTGFAIHKKDASWEKEVVLKWAIKLTDMPPNILERLTHGHCATEKELDTRTVIGGAVFYCVVKRLTTNVTPFGQLG